MKRLGTLMLSCAMLLSACAPKGHRVEPYESDTAAASQLEVRAERACAESSDPVLGTIDKRFITDGCSMWFDRGWEQCCVEHDIPYFCGGSAEMRQQADRELQACVAKVAPSWLANMTYLGVRIGGHPAYPTHYRWGFGRSYWPWYSDPPTPENSRVGPRKPFGRPSWARPPGDPLDETPADRRGPGS